MAPAFNLFNFPTAIGIGGILFFTANCTPYLIKLTPLSQSIRVARLSESVNIRQIADPIPPSPAHETAASFPIMTPFPFSLRDSKSQVNRFPSWTNSYVRPLVQFHVPDTSGIDTFCVAVGSDVTTINCGSLVDVVLTQASETITRSAIANAMGKRFVFIFFVSPPPEYYSALHLRLVLAVVCRENQPTKRNMLFNRKNQSIWT